MNKTTLKREITKAQNRAKLHNTSNGRDVEVRQKALKLIHKYTKLLQKM